MSSTQQYLERITINANICHSRPCIRGMRWPVEVILDMLSSGMSASEILEDIKQTLTFHSLKK